MKKKLTKKNIFPTLKIFTHLFVLSIIFLSCQKEDPKPAVEVPKKATLKLPANASTGISLLPSLKWSLSSDGSGQTTYEVYLDKNVRPTTKITGNMTGDTMLTLLNTLENNTVYYWRVVSKLNNQTDSSSIFSFTTTSAPKIPVASISIVGGTPIEMTVTEVDTITIRVAPKDATNKNFTVSSTSPAIVKVGKINDTNVVISALSAGKSTISITSVDDPSKVLTFEITASLPTPIPVSGVTLSKTSGTIDAGKNDTFAVRVAPNNAFNKNFSVNSSNTNIATVAKYQDTLIVITTLSAGTATITVNTTDGNKMAAYSLTVSGTTIPVSRVALSKTAGTFEAGKKDTFAVRVAPNNATNKNFTVTSSNETVATVAKYQDTLVVITTLAAGTATITVNTTDGNQTATYNLTVNSATIAVSGVALSKTAGTFEAGKKDTFAVRVVPNNATNKNFTVTSSNESVATVAKYQDTLVVITTLAAGTATITVNTTDGNQTTTYNLTVNSATVAVSGVSLNKDTVWVAINDTRTIVPTVLPSNATNKNVSWTSLNSAVATVNPNGVITAIASGTTMVIATTQDGSKKDTVTVYVLTKFDNLTTTYRFAYNGHTYYIVNQPKNWEVAASEAVSVGGHLVHIENQLEQNEIVSQIGKSKLTFTAIAGDGGGANYIWIGATDKTTEGTWQWNGTNAASGTTFGVAGTSYNNLTSEWTLNLYTASAYANWGLTSKQNEPDNYSDSQDCGAIGLSSWLLGYADQWNDLNETNTLPFLIEIE